LAVRALQGENVKTELGVKGEDQKAESDGGVLGEGAASL